jgi:hypothetical protein
MLIDVDLCELRISRLELIEALSRGLVGKRRAAIELRKMLSIARHFARIDCGFFLDALSLSFGLLLALKCVALSPERLGLLDSEGL